jgi:hypothetical protein
VAHLALSPIPDSDEHALHTGFLVHLAVTLKKGCPIVQRCSPGAEHCKGTKAELVKLAPLDRNIPHGVYSLPWFTSKQTLLMKVQAEAGVQAVSQVIEFVVNDRLQIWKLFGQRLGAVECESLRAQIETNDNPMGADQRSYLRRGTIRHNVDLCHEVGKIRYDGCESFAHHVTNGCPTVTVEDFGTREADGDHA